MWDIDWTLRFREVMGAFFYFGPSLGKFSQSLHFYHYFINLYCIVVRRCLNCLQFVIVFCAVYASGYVFACTMWQLTV